METTNPATEVADQATGNSDLSIEERFAQRLSGKDKQPADEAKASTDQADDTESEDVEAEEATDDEAAKSQAKSEEATTEETAEIEIDGETYVMPKKLEAAFLKSKDYTHKTMELAERRKTVEEREAFLERVEKTRGAIFDKAAELKALDAQIERYKAIDWDTLAADQSDEGRTQYLRLDRAARALQEQQAAKRGEIQQAIAEAEKAYDTDWQSRAAKALTEISDPKTGIKGWSETLNTKLKQTALDSGFSEQEIRNFMAVDSRVARLVADAHAWRELQKAKTSGLIKKKVETAKPVTVKAARSAQTNAQAGLADAARARLKKTGSTRDAEEAFFRRLDARKR